MILLVTATSNQLGAAEHETSRASLLLKQRATNAPCSECLQVLLSCRRSLADLSSPSPYCLRRNQEPVAVAHRSPPHALTRKSPTTATNSDPAFGCGSLMFIASLVYIQLAPRIPCRSLRASAHHFMCRDCALCPCCPATAFPGKQALQVHWSVAQGGV